MKTKFSKKLLALFLAMVMILTAFTGAFSAFAADESYYDDNITADQVNDLGWAVLTDEQTADALLDYLDSVLATIQMDPISVNNDIAVVIHLNIKLNSVNDLLDAINQIQQVLDDNAGLVDSLGDAKNIDLSPIRELSYVESPDYYCGKDYRSQNDSIKIVTTLFKIIEKITANWDGSKAVLKQVLTGQLNLGLLESGLVDILGFNIDVYGMIGDMLGGLIGAEVPSDYKDNIVHRIVALLLTNLTDWYTDEEATHIYYGDAGYELDTVLFQALSTKLLQQINVNITYPDGTTSVERYAEGNTDPKLFYTNDGNVYIFRYDENEDDVDDVNLTLEPGDNLFEFSMEALEVAWKTALSPTLGQLNYAVNDYDWNYAKWFDGKGYTWDHTNPANNYSADKVEAWASETGVDLEQVKTDLTFNRAASDSETHSWRDIQSQYLFNKVCRSPLMAYYFQETTGPLNTNIKTVGMSNIERFFANDFSNYSSILAGFNDFLVAAVKDFLPDYDASALATTGNTTDPTTISTTLVSNALKVVQYVADATDANILAAFYENYGPEATLSEETFEEAMLPFLIACLENNLDSLMGQIHKDKWDACDDAEGVAGLALQEYLAYILPENDYSSFVEKGEDGFYDVTLEDLLAMARDAVGYVMTQYVPVTDGNGNPWSIYDVTAAQSYEEQVSSKTDLLSLLNSVVVYYANERGAGALLGCIDPATAECTITLENTIWQNIDIAANHLLPVLGELQYGTTDKHGKFNSEELIWNDIVKGVLDIGNADIHDGRGGITNFIYRLATIIGAPSISSKGIVNVAYDFVKDLLNGIVGPRYTNSYYYDKGAEAKVIPDNTSLHPFHDLIQRDCIAGTVGDDTDIGVIGKFVVNVAEASGYTKNSTTYPDTFWNGAMFAVNAVASFVPGFMPSIQTFQLKDLETAQSKGAQSSYNYGNSITFDITLTNPSYGINRYIRNEAGEFVQQPRAYMQIDSVTADKGSFTYSSYDNNLEPSESVTFTATGNLAQGDFGGAQDTVVSFTVNYRIVEEDGQPYAHETDDNGTYDKTFTKVIRFYVTTVKDWYNLTYDNTGASPFTEESFSPQQNPQSGTYSSWSQRITEAFGYPSGSWIPRNLYANVQYPNNVVVRTTQIENINYPLYIWNETNGKGIDGVIAVKNIGGSDYLAASCDSVTGDVVNVFFYDYYKNGEWVNDALTRDALMTAMENDSTITDYRFHVVATRQQVEAHTASFGDGFVPANHQYEMSADGSYKQVWLQLDSANYKTAFEYSMTQPGDFSLASGIPGIVIAFQKVTTNGSNIQSNFLYWDQETQVQGGTNEGSEDIRFVAATPATVSIPITVVDDSGEAEAAAAISSQIGGFLNNYTSADVENAEVYEYFSQAATDALAAQEYPITMENADQYASTKAYNEQYVSTTNAIGDVAYKLASADTVKQYPEIINTYNLFENGGYYYATRYLDKATDTYVYKNPVLSTELATPGNGLESTGDYRSLKIGSYPEQEYEIFKLAGTDTEVVYVREQGEDDTAQYHLLNDVQYVKDWVDLDGTNDENRLYSDPYFTDTDELATDATGNQLYDEIQFTYVRANNTTSSSTDDDWVLKIATTSYGIVAGADQRGDVAQLTNKAEYAYQLVQDYINVDYPQTLFDHIVALTSTLNNANFEVIGYENMMSMSRQAEALITVDYYNDYYYYNESGERTHAFGCVDSAAEDNLAVFNADLEEGEQYELADFEKVTDFDKSVATPNTYAFEVNEAIRLFDLYMEGVYERGYMGTKLEEEISCAVNGKTGADKDVTTTPYTSVTVDVEAQSYAVDGATYTADNNKDGVTYTAESWAAFIDALDAAVNAAVAGNTTYEHKDAGKYVPENPLTDEDTYLYQVSDVYTIRTNLMRAENGLTTGEAVEPAEGYTVTAYVGALASPDDQYGSFATTGATVTVTTGVGTEITGTTDDNGMFTLQNVPNGTYEAKVTYAYGFDRTFTLIVNGADVNAGTDQKIGIVACDWDKSGDISVGDVAEFAKYRGQTSGQDGYVVGFDIDRSGDIAVGDMSNFVALRGSAATSMQYKNITIQN